MAANHFDFTYFMTKDEKKKLKPEQEPQTWTTPRMPDLDKAERIVTSKEDIKKMQLERQ
jgi:hypothetical protein